MTRRHLCCFFIQVAECVIFNRYIDIYIIYSVINARIINLIYEFVVVKLGLSTNAQNSLYYCHFISSTYPVTLRVYSNSFHFALFRPSNPHVQHMLVHKRPHSYGKTKAVARMQAQISFHCSTYMSFNSSIFRFCAGIVLLHLLPINLVSHCKCKQRTNFCHMEKLIQHVS